MSRKKDVEILDCQIRVVLRGGKPKSAMALPLFESGEKVIFTPTIDKGGVLVTWAPKVKKSKKKGKK